MTGPLAPVLLRTGDTVPEAVLLTVRMTLQHLISDPASIVALFELWQLAHDPGHDPFGLTGVRLDGLGLTCGGRLNTDTAAVVRASLDVDGSTVRLVPAVTR